MDTINIVNHLRVPVPIMAITATIVLTPAKTIHLKTKVAMDKIATAEVVMQAAIVVITMVGAMDMEVAEAAVEDIIVTLVVAIVEVNIFLVSFAFFFFSLFVKSYIFCHSISKFTLYFLKNDSE